MVLVEEGPRISVLLSVKSKVKNPLSSHFSIGAGLFVLPGIVTTAKLKLVIEKQLLLVGSTTFKRIVLVVDE